MRSKKHSYNEYIRHNVCSSNLIRTERIHLQHENAFKKQKKRKNTQKTNRKTIEQREKNGEE